MRNFINNITDALLLMESGDTKFDIGHRLPMTLEDEHKKQGIEKHDRYDLDGGKSGQVIIYHKKDCIELHHEIKENGKPISGEMVPNRTNVRKFYGTMKHFGTRIVDSGRTLKIVGNHTNGMFQHYNKMAHMLAREKGYIVTQAKPYDVNPKECSEIEIRKPSKDSPIHESILLQHTMFRKNKTIMEYNGTPYIVPRDFLDDLVDDIKGIK